MTGSMVESILGMVTPDMKNGLALRLGESLEGVQSGLGAATAAALSGLDRKSAHSRCLEQVLGLLERQAGQTIVADLPSIAPNGPTGTTAKLVNRFLPMAFSTQRHEVEAAVSHHAGLHAASGRGLLKMAAALVLAYLAKVQSADSLNVKSLGNMLRAEESNLHSYLPASLLPGAPVVPATRPARSQSARWLLPLGFAGVLLFAALVIRLLSGPDTEGPG